MPKHMLREGTTTTIPLDEIREELFVRKRGLDQDHVAQLWILYDAGVKLPPIKVTTDWILVDGRHRLEAMRVAELKEAEVEVVATKGLEKNEVLLKAFEANLGGSLPPKTEDIHYTIKQMLSHGWSERQVENKLPYPKSVAHKYVRDASLERRRESKIVAIELLAKGYTLAAAAREAGITEADLKLALEGARKRQITLNSRKGAISSAFKSLGLRLGTMLNQTIDDYSEGKLNEAAAWEHLNHAQKLAEGVLRSVIDKKKRFESELETRSAGSSSSKAVKELDVR